MGNTKYPSQLESGLCEINEEHESCAYCGHCPDCEATEQDDADMFLSEIDAEFSVFKTHFEKLPESERDSFKKELLKMVDTHFV